MIFDKQIWKSEFNISSRATIMIILREARHLDHTSNRLKIWKSSLRYHSSFQDNRSDKRKLLKLKTIKSVVHIANLKSCTMRFIYLSDKSVSVCEQRRLFPFESVLIIQSRPSIAIIRNSETGSFVTLPPVPDFWRDLYKLAHRGLAANDYADAGRTQGGARKLAHHAKRKWNIVDERSGGKCYRQGGWESAPDPWAGVERRARGEKAEEEDEDKMYRLELACSFE